MVFCGDGRILGFCWLVNGGRVILFECLDGGFCFFHGFFFCKRILANKNTNSLWSIVVFGRCFKGAFLKS